MRPVADTILLTTLVFFALQVVFAFQLHRPAIFTITFAGVAVGAAAMRFLGPPVGRINAALLLTPLLIGISLFEIYFAVMHPRDGTAAWLAGRPFDSRTLMECLKEERRQDPSVVSYLIPRALLTHHLLLEPWEPEALAHTVRPDWGVTVDGVRTLPLSGVANRRTVFSNESGQRIYYESDEHGFNNPHSIWGAGDLQIAILGDSYSHGAGVAPQDITAAHIRERFPRTLTLGMAANGPLMEYASLKEYVVDLKPHIVLWAYYMNDLSDLDVEKQSPLLRRYVDDDDFRQGLAAKQPKVDEVLTAYLEDVERQAPQHWSPRLDAVGLTRRSTPLWLQDLITTEAHSSVAGALRLDGSIWTVTKRFLEVNYFEQPPDYELFERILGKARDTVASWGGRLYFVYLPAVSYLGRRGNPVVLDRAEVLAVVQRLGIPLIDVHKVFAERPDSYRLRFNDESHATEEGYALHAKVILDGLAAAVEPATLTGIPDQRSN